MAVVFQDQIPRCTLKLHASEDKKNLKDVVYSSKYIKIEGFKHNWWQMNHQKNAILMESHLVAHHSNSQFEEAAKSAIEHICFIFRLSVTRVSVDVGEIPNFTSLFIWDFLRGSCPDVQLHGRECVIQDFEVWLFFENFRIEKRFALEVKNTGRIKFQFCKLKSLDFLVLRNANWMRDYHFEQLNCEFLEVHRTRITSRAIIHWLNKWMNSSDTKTKALIVSSTLNSLDSFLVVQGITHTMNFEVKNENIG